MSDATTPPPLFDRLTLRQRRARIAAQIGAHDFLLRRAAEDIGERLATIRRDFPLALDLGAHHGVLGDVLRARPEIGMVISADSCAPLLARCAAPRVLCDEEALPFADASLDLVASALALHFVNDLPGTLVQIRHMLKPDGLLLAAIFGGQTLHELRAAFLQAEMELLGGASPHVMPMADVRDYGGLLQRAGFALPVADADVVTVTYESAFALMHELRAMGAGNVLTERARTLLRRDVLMRAAELYAEHFPAPGGRVRATFEIIHLAGWAPDESQQKPLRPGSARMRLADALGVQEYSAGDAGRPAPPKKQG